MIEGIKASLKLQRQNTEAIGYLEMAIKAKDQGDKEGEERMRLAALSALEKLTDDDFDAIYDLDQKEQDPSTFDDEYFFK